MKLTPRVKSEDLPSRFKLLNKVLKYLISQDCLGGHTGTVMGLKIEVCQKCMCSLEGTDDQHSPASKALSCLIKREVYIAPHQGASAMLCLFLNSVGS